MGAPAFCCPSFPLASLLFFCAEHQAAKLVGKIAASKMFGRAGSLSTAGCAKATDTRQGVGYSEGIAVTPIPDDGLGGELWQNIIAMGHAKKGMPWPANPAR